jgi:hypothetical protein
VHQGLHETIQTISFQKKETNYAEAGAFAPISKKEEEGNKEIEISCKDEKSNTYLKIMPRMC